MTYRFEFELDGLPPTTNGSHGSWQKAAANKRLWRTRTKLRTFMERPKEPLTKCRITATRFSSVEPDDDNLAISFKSVIDGLKDAGVIQDDKTSVVIERKYLWEISSPRKGKIRVLVEEIKQGGEDELHTGGEV